MRTNVRLFPAVLTLGMLLALEASAQQELIRALAAGEPTLAEMLSGVEAYRQWNSEAGSDLP